MSILNLTLVYDKDRIQKGDTLPDALGIDPEFIVEAHKLVVKRRDAVVKKSKEEEGNDGTCVFNTLTDFFEAYEADLITPDMMLLYLIAGYTSAMKYPLVKADGFKEGFEFGRQTKGMPDSLADTLKDAIMGRITDGASFVPAKEGSMGGRFLKSLKDLAEGAQG